MIYINRIPRDWPAELGLDIETTGLDPFTGQILSVCLSDGHDTWLFTRKFEVLKDVLEDETVTKIIHNAAFDVKWLQIHLNIVVKNVFDTLIAERLLNMGKQQPNDLKFVLAHRFGVVLDKETRESFEDRVSFDEKPMTTDEFEYIIHDVEHLPRLKAAQMAEVSKKTLGRVLKIELDLLPVVIQMETEGVRCDVDLWEQYLPQFSEQVNLHETKLREFLGEGYVLPVQRTKKGEKVVVEVPVEDINYGSPQQINALFAQMDIDVPNTSAPILAEWLEENKDHPNARFVDYLLAFRHWQKLSGWDYPKYVHPVTGMVHPHWNQLGPGTGRLSCSDPNLQNVPRPTPGEPNLRNLWIPDTKDYVILGADYSQQEPRIFAHLCQDPAMIEACNNEDVYIEFAKYMFGRTIEKDSEERYIAKQFVLAVGYGAGAQKLHKTSGLPLKECERIRNIIRDTFPIMVSWSQEQYRKVMTYGHTRTAVGRIRYLTTAYDRKFTNAVNSPVQGTAADMTKYAIVRCNNYLKSHNLDARVWITVHDEIEIQVPKALAESLLPAIINEMEEAGKEICPSVLHVAEGKIYEVWDK